MSNENFQNHETHYQKSTAIEELQNVRDLIDKTDKPFNNQKSFSESESTTPSSFKGKRRIKKSHLHKPLRLYNWKQPIRHTESYTVTVIPHEKRIKTTKILKFLYLF